MYMLYISWHIRTVIKQHLNCPQPVAESMQML